MYPPVDPYRDGYVALLRVQLLDDGPHAESTATIAGYATGGAGDLGHFIRQLADDWRAGAIVGYGTPSNTETTVDAENDRAPRTCAAWRVD